MEKLATRGQETELVSAMVRQFPYGKVPAERAQQLIEHQDELAALLVTMLTSVVSAVASAWQTLLASCKQNWVNSDVTEEHFPLVDDGTVNPVEECCLGHDVSTGKKAEAELKKLGYKLVGMKRAMEYIAKHPDSQLDHPVVVLGAQWRHPDGHVSVPYFDRNDDKRDLHLGWIDDEFNSFCRFLVSRE